MVYRLNGTANDLLVIECKNDAAVHASDAVENALDLDTTVLEAESYAEDGVIHYMRGLRADFNVVGLAISGTDRDELRISHFKCTQNGTVTRLDLNAIQSPSRYLTLLGEVPEDASAIASIGEFAEELHEFFRDEMELSEPEKPLLVSAVLLALRVKAFRRGYRSEDTGANLAKNLLSSVERKLEDEGLHLTKVELMMRNFAFIRDNTELHAHLHETVARIESNILGAVSSHHNIDLLGDFYGEFLKYSGGDKKGLGIVLTPRHITGLFAKLSGLEKDSVLLDPCAGTGGFLIAGMAEMIKKAKMDDDSIEEIKRQQLVGIEQNDRMFTLACSNMLLRGDGKSNMFKGSCFDPVVRAKINSRSVVRERDRAVTHLAALRSEFPKQRLGKKREKTRQQIEELENLIEELKALLDDPIIKKERIKRAPTAAILNPHYAKKASDKHEFAFVYSALELLEPGGTCIAIVPMSCATDINKANREWKRRLLEHHTLVAGISMPDQLFPSIGVVTVALIFTAHKPNHEDHETWFAYWKDDGFKLRKGRRVEIKPWHDTESRWLTSFRRRTVSTKFSVLRHVSENNEWCSEAYLEPDYSEISEAELLSVMRQYVLNAFHLRASRPEDITESEAESA